MGALSNVMDLLKGASKELKKHGDVRAINASRKTIIRRAGDYTFQFPCIISDSMTVEMSSVLVKMLDRVYAGYTQIALGNESSMRLSTDRTPAQFLKRFHQNLKFERAYPDLADLYERTRVPEDEWEEKLEAAYNGNYTLYSDPTHSVYFLVNENVKRLGILEEQNWELLSPYKGTVVREATDDGGFVYTIKESSPIFEDSTDELTGADLVSSIARGKEKRQQIEMMRLQLQARKGATLSEGDVKTLNEMVPFAIQLRLSVINDEDEFVQYMDCVVGIKTVMHLVSSSDMIQNIVHALQNRSRLFRFIRWTTGEISFFKDLLLHMDDIRFDAANQNHGKSPLFGNLKQLKRRGFHLPTIRGTGVTLPYGLVPNATIVISGFEYQNILDNYGIDLKNVSVAKQLMNMLSLMTFIVCDDSIRTYEVLYDGAAAFQTYAMESVEREVSLSSNKLGREIGRMLTH